MFQPQLEYVVSPRILLGKILIFPNLSVSPTFWFHAVNYEISRARFRSHVNCSEPRYLRTLCSRLSKTTLAFGGIHPTRSRIFISFSLHKTGIILPFVVGVVGGDSGPCLRNTPPPPTRTHSTHIHRIIHYTAITRPLNSSPRAFSKTMRGCSFLAAFFTAHRVLAHPLCYVGNRPTDYDEVLTFCPEAQQGACCTDAEEAEVQARFEAAGTLTDDCADLYKQVRTRIYAYAKGRSALIASCHFLQTRVHAYHFG